MVFCVKIRCMLALCASFVVALQGINFDRIKTLSSQEPSLVPVLVIGSGVAGLSAALYTARAQLHTLVLAGHEPGGQLMGSSLVENMPGVPAVPGYKVIDRMEEQAREVGVHFISDTVADITPSVDGDYYIVHTEDGRLLHALTIIIATGASPNKLEIPGEDTYANAGVFTCAVCDCRQATGKTVAVVGGGDSAIEAVMHLAPYAKKITMIVRGKALRASAVMQEKLKKYEHVSVVYEHTVQEICGTLSEDGEPAVTGLQLKDGHTSQVYLFPIDCTFVTIGHTPNSGLFSSLIAVDDHGYILLEGRTQQTSRPGIFAAGDVTDPRYKQAGRASGDAAAAGLDAIAYLHEHGFSTHVANELTPWYFKEV